MNKREAVKIGDGLTAPSTEQRYAVVAYTVDLTVSPMVPKWFLEIQETDIVYRTTRRQDAEAARDAENERAIKGDRPWRYVVVAYRVGAKLVEPKIAPPVRSLGGKDWFTTAKLSAINARIMALVDDNVVLDRILTELADTFDLTPTVARITFGEWLLARYDEEPE